MASATLIAQLTAYYVQLLIVQYHNLPKAQATIALLAEEFIANGVIFDVQQGYNIDPTLGATAVGTQLDVIGKYLGINRFTYGLNLSNYFAFISYTERLSLPTSPPRFGLSTYATFNNASYNGTLSYIDVVTSENALSDSDFLTLIQFMVQINNMNYSAQAIDMALFAVFGTTLHAESSYNMNMVYFLIGPASTLLNTILLKKLLPAPMGVGISLVQNITGKMFAFTNYKQATAGAFSSYGYGFSTYSNYATLSGQTLSYANISSLS